MSVDTSDLQVRNNPDENRYEVELDGKLAKIDYKLRDDLITFTHTEVPLEMEGKGIASKMVRFALNDVREQGYRVRPICPFVKGYIERHPEYEDLLHKNE